MFCQGYEEKMTSSLDFTKEDFSRLLTALNAELQRRGIQGSIVVAGGAAMMYAFNSRKTTADIDGLFHPAGPMRECIAAVAESEGVSEGWLNDGVKGFYNGNTMRSLPLFKLSNLTVERLDNESLLALKLTSARTTGSKDLEDAKVLAAHIGISTVEQALDIVESRIPKQRIPTVTQYFASEVLDSLQAQKEAALKLHAPLLRIFLTQKDIAKTKDSPNSGIESVMHDLSISIDAHASALQKDRSTYFGKFWWRQFGVKREDAHTLNSKEPGLFERIEQHHTELVTLLKQHLATPSTQTTKRLGELSKAYAGDLNKAFGALNPKQADFGFSGLYMSLDTHQQPKTSHRTSPAPTPTHRPKI